MDEEADFTPLAYDGNDLHDIDPALLAIGEGEDALDMDDDEYEDGMDLSQVENTIEAHRPIDQDDDRLEGIEIPFDPLLDPISSNAVAPKPTEHIKHESLLNDSMAIDHGTSGMTRLSSTASVPQLPKPSANTTYQIKTHSKISPSIDSLPVPSMIPVSSTPEEESLKIAIELQAQEFGLRSRRSAG